LEKLSREYPAYGQWHCVTRKDASIFARYVAENNPISVSRLWRERRAFLLSEKSDRDAKIVATQ
jgi:hypothetical protein